MPSCERANWGRPVMSCAVEEHAARGRRQLARDQLEERGLAGAVGPDDRAQLARLHLEITAFTAGGCRSSRELLGAQDGSRDQVVAPRRERLVP